MPADRKSLDAAIEAARARGAFDDLPGHGKPLEPDELGGLPAEERFEARLMRSLKEISPEVALVREIRALRAELSSRLPDSEAAAGRAELTEKLKQLQEALTARRATR